MEFPCMRNSTKKAPEKQPKLLRSFKELRLILLQMMNLTNNLKIHLRLVLETENLRILVNNKDLLHQDKMVSLDLQIGQSTIGIRFQCQVVEEVEHQIQFITVGPCKVSKEMLHFLEAVEIQHPVAATSEVAMQME